MPELLSEKLVKANKSHNCDLCHGEILKNSKYLRQNSKDGDDIYTFKMHCHCNQLISLLKIDTYPDGCTEDAFYSAVDDFINYEMPLWFKARMIHDFFAYYKGVKDGTNTISE